MTLRYLMGPLAALLVLAGPAFAACDEYIAVDNAQAKEAMALLSKPEGDPIDKLSAFELLSCSDKPVLRAYAMKSGLNGISDEIVRGQILMEMLMQRKLIRVMMKRSSNLDQEGKELVERVNGVLDFENRFQDRTQGCVSLGQTTECEKNASLYFRGTTVDLMYSYGSLTGQFTLTPDNKLLGVMRVSGRSADIASEIVLFE
ncbi:MAG: hypothetical protein U1E15_06615 [Hyphomicrobiales bacterium]